MRQIAIVAMSLAAMACVRGMDTREALLAERYTAILASTPSNATAAERLWEIYALNGKTGDLLESFRQLSQDNAVLNLPLANFLLRSGQNVEASESLDKLPLDEMDFSGKIEAGRLWTQLGNKEKAREIWENAASHASGNIPLLKDLAAAHLDAGETSSARRVLLQLTDKGSPSDRLEALETIVTTHEMEGDFASAEDRALEILEMLEPGHWKTPSATSRALSLAQKAGTLDVLENQWQQQAQQRPEIFIRLSELAAFRGDTHKRLQWLAEAADAHPQDRSLVRQRGGVELALADFAAAQSTFEQLVEADPDDQSARLALAEVLALQGEESLAVAQIEEISRRSPDFSEANKLEILRKLNLQDSVERILRSRCKEDSFSAALDLARFLLEAGRPSEAVQSLEGLAWKKLSNPEKGLVQVALFLKEAQLLGPAELWARRACLAEPANPAHTLLLADILESRGDHPSALSLLRESADGTLPHEELDRRLFYTFQREDSREDPALRNTTTKQFSEILMEKARTMDSADAWLRAARWSGWLGETRTAAECLQAGLGIDENAKHLLPPLSEALEKIGDPEGAINALVKLKTLQPEERSTIDRQIARLEVQRGNPEAAVATLTAQRKDFPKDWSLLRDLAIAQEATGNHFAALDVWIEVFRAAPPEERSVLVRHLLATFSRLGLIARARSFLDASEASFPAGSARQEFLRAKEDFIRTYEGTAVWKETIEAQSKTAGGPDNPFSSDDLAVETRRSQLKEAFAKASKEGDEALELARQLAQPPEGGLEDDLALARTLEANGKREEALAAWRHILKRHSRSREALVDSAGALGRLGDKDGQLEGWRKASRLGDVPAHTLLELGRRTAQKGDNLQALEDFKRVLTTTLPEPDIEKIPFPRPSRLLRQSEEDFLTPMGSRLLALHEAGKLLANSPEKIKQINTLGSANLVERAWALWAADEPTSALDALKPLVPTNDKATEYFQLVLEAGHAGRLAGFLKENPDGWSEFLAATRNMVSAGWRPKTADFLPKDTPPFARLRFVNILAENGALRDAVAVGIPEGLSPVQAADAWYRLASWQLALREPDGAADALEKALAQPPFTLDNRAASAMRARWLLEPPETRQALRIFSALPPEGRPLADLLIAALDDDTESLPHHIRRWINGWHLSPDAALVRAIREGSRLEAWHLGRAARELYRTALETFQPLPGTESTFTTKRVLENAIISSRLDGADPALAEFLIREWVARSPHHEELASAGARAAGLGRIAIARELYGQAFLLAPGDTRSWTRLLSLAPFPEGFPEILPKWFLSATPTRRGWIPSNTLLQLAQTLTAAGRESEALEVLSAEGIQDPDGRIATQRAVLHTSLGDARSAMDALDSARRHESLNKESQRLGLASGSPHNHQTQPSGNSLLQATPESAAEALAAYLKSNPPAEEALSLYENLARSRTELANILGRESLRNLVDPSCAIPSLAPRGHLALLSLSKLTGTESALETELTSQWLDGNTIAAEILIRLAIERGDSGKLNSLVEDLLERGLSGQRALFGLAGLLLQNSHPELAVRVYEDLDRDGIQDPAHALSFAEALWKCGRRAEAIDISDALFRSAAIDPGLHVPLAAFHASVNRPDKAARSLDPKVLPPLAAYRAAPLRSAVAGQFLERQRPDDARHQLSLAAQFPGTIDPEILLRFLQTTGQFNPSNPSETPFELHPHDQNALLEYLIRPRRDHGSGGVEWFPSGRIRYRGPVQRAHGFPA